MKGYAYGMVVLVLIASCGQEKSEDGIKEKPSVLEAAKPVDEGTFDPIPPGAHQETFEDKPGLVRITVTQGPNIVGQGNYLNGKREGIWSEFQPNGLLKSATSYVNGVKEGLYVELNQSGQVTKRFFYHNNVRHGEYKEFNYSTLKEERTYKLGKLEGLVKIYYDDGKIMEEGVYVNGLRDGVSRWYDQNGNMTITYEYKNGELIKK